jgi:DNA-binding NtrC family response regulator
LDPKTFSKSAIDRLMDYPWTGNIRELKNVIERLMILGSNPVTVDDIEQFAAKPKL